VSGKTVASLGSVRQN